MGHLSIFPKNAKKSFFPNPETRLSAKKLANCNERDLDKVKNPVFWAYWTKKAKLGSFWPKWANGKFFKRALGTILLHF